MGPSTTPTGSHPEALPLALVTKRCRTPPKHLFCTLSPKVSLKNEFSLGTHQAGWVPTWSLYNTHGLAPLTFDPFLGYTGVKPFIQQ